MDIDGKVVSNFFMDREIKCPDCGTKCFMVAFNKIPEDAIEAAKKKELYVGEMPGTKDHIIGICPKCTDLVKKVEKNTDNNIDNNSPATE